MVPTRKLSLGAPNGVVSAIFENNKINSWRGITPPTTEKTTTKPKNRNKRSTTDLLDVLDASHLVEAAAADDPDAQRRHVRFFFVEVKFSKNCSKPSTEQR
jgi:hypothetical protein